MQEPTQLSRVGEIQPAPAAAEPSFVADEQLDLSKYVVAVRRRWLLLLMCVLISSGYAIVRYSLTPKEFQARTTIQIERKRLSLLALGQAAWMEDWWNMEYYPTQYRLLRSRGMAERVVRDLRLYEQPAFGGGNVKLDLSEADSGAMDGATSMHLARLAMSVQGGLEVTPIPETQLVEIIYRSTSPELAAEISNTYAEVFIQWGKENRTDTVNQASSYLDSQIATLRQEIEEGQKRMNAYQSSSDFALDPAGEALLERRQSLDQRYNAAVAARISKEAAYKGLLNLSPETVANTTQSGGRVSSLKSEVSRLEVEYDAKLEEFQPHWPEMVALKNEIDKKKGELQRLTASTFTETKDRAFAEFQKAKGEEESLAEERRRLATDARLKNSDSLEYTDILTYINTRRELLAELVKRQSEVASQMQTTKESNVRIVDRAIVPGAPFRPSLKRNLTMALALGLMVGLGITFLLEFLDRTIKSPEELESITGLPTLTVIPDISDGRGSGGRFRYGKKGYGYGYGYGYGSDGEASKALTKGEDGKEFEIELLPHVNPRLAICEAYRSLRTALLLSSTQELRTLAVTSAEPGEGKTATTVNLAVVMAQLGRRVLIIDGDLRRPRMHKVFSLSNRLGLVSFLTGHVDINRIFDKTVVPNLFVATSGPIPPNPSELLSSARMREFLAAVRQEFDFVILDTPPALPVADAVILGPQADGLIVCARAGVLQRDDAKMCREQLRYAGVRIFGTVLNRYRSSPTRYSRRYQYYGVYSESTESSSSAA